MGEPDWWRGSEPASDPAEPWEEGNQLTGDVTADDVAAVPMSPSYGFRVVSLLEARLSGGEVWLSDVLLRVAWSEVEGVRFRQRVKPVLVHQGTAAQGTFALRPSLYRGCHFERVRFTALGGFSTGVGRYEDCTFADCRWGGSSQGSADFVGCTFTGAISGAVFLGESAPWLGEASPRRNIIRDNDFSGAAITNTAFRSGFPVADQRWPEGYRPVVDDADA